MPNSFASPILAKGYQCHDQNEDLEHTKDQVDVVYAICLFSTRAQAIDSLVAQAVQGKVIDPVKTSACRLTFRLRCPLACSS